MPDDRIAPAIRRRIERDDSALLTVAIGLDPGYPQGAAVAKARVQSLFQDAMHAAAERTEQNMLPSPNEADGFVYARLSGKVLRAMLTRDATPGPPAIAFVRPDIDDGKIFNPDNMISTVISVPMLRQMEEDETALRSVMIEVNINYGKGRSEAKNTIQRLVNEARDPADPGQGVVGWKTDSSDQFVYAKLRGKTIRNLVASDKEHSIYHIWPDFKVRAQIWKSVPTVKGDACRRAFASTGKGIVWAVFDSGIDGDHPHFKKHSNLALQGPLKHMDFTGLEPLELKKPADGYGHGTHVAGIIAGELDQTAYTGVELTRERDPEGKISYRESAIRAPVLGVAPECRLVSYKILDDTGEGDASTIIAAIQYVQELNGNGRQIVIHGVNMSLGYDFDPEWFACGQSPLCVEVDRLVRSGVVVVIAAGNTGKGFALTINDPGNAELAITVGATHREMPHRYGVSYFSSKGPTGDGRRKPDLLAPGEKIVSCAAGPDLVTYQAKAQASGVVVKYDPPPAYYLERSGTSMAAPHVSGIVAGLLSVRSEFIGLPDELKKALVENATDLGRDPNFQGGGLADMMRTIQSI